MYFTIMDFGKATKLFADPALMDLLYRFMNLVEMKTQFHHDEEELILPDAVDI